MINIDKIQKEAAAIANNVGYCGYCGNYQYLFFHLILDIGWQIKCGECGARTDFYKNINVSDIEKVMNKISDSEYKSKIVKREVKIDIFDQIMKNIDVITTHFMSHF